MFEHFSRTFCTTKSNIRGILVQIMYKELVIAVFRQKY